MQKIVPFLWFDGNAEEAMDFYTSVFRDSKVVKITRYKKGWPGPEGAVMVGKFQLEGQEFYALNGRPGEIAFTPAISFLVKCETQQEIDELWEKLTQGGEEVQCGWLRDRFGVSWQITPTMLEQMLSDPEAEMSDRVFNAMLGMVKLDIAGLKRAYDGQ